MKTYEIDRRKLGKRIGCIVGSDADNGRFEYKNVVFAFIDGCIPVLIKSNLDQRQFNMYMNGKLSREELHKII